MIVQTSRDSNTKPTKRNSALTTSITLCHLANDFKCCSLMDIDEDKQNACSQNISFTSEKICNTAFFRFKKKDAAIFPATIVQFKICFHFRLTNTLN
jgi:hypothetical protein